MSKENDENTPPIHVLLPICTEASTDVFLNVLTSVVYHTRLHDNFPVHSIISGLTGEMFQVDTDDLSVDWNKLTSNLRQIRQYKLLGIWAARNYPLIGKKLVGAAWQPPKKCSVQVNESIEIAEQEIDNIVSKKMKLRIIEVNVGKNTSKRMKYFVPVPMGIGRINFTYISPKIRAFDIESAYLEGCWQALKLGGFPSGSEQQMHSTAIKAPQPSVVTSHLVIDQLVRRNYDRSTVEERQSSPTRLSNAMSSLSQDIVTSPCSVLLTNISASTAQNGVASKNAKRTRCASLSNSTREIVHDETNFDALRVAVVEMRKDIQCLTKCQTVTTEKNEKLQEELTTVKNRLGYFDSNFQCEKQDLLQKLSAANQLNCDLTDTNGKLREDLNVAKNHSANVECNVQDFVQKLSAADEVNVTLTETNGKLQEDLNATNNHFTEMESILQCRIQDLVCKLSTADRMNVDLTDTNCKLHQELNAVRGHASNTESNLQYQIQDLVHKLSTADRTNVELTETNGKLQEDLNAANNHFTEMESNLQCRIQELVHKLSTADRTNVELTDTNGKVQQELHAVRGHAANMESNLQNQIEDLVHKLSAADHTNIVMTDTILKLQQKLDAAKIELKENEKLSDLTARTNNLISEFKIKLEETEKMNAQLSGENEELRKELNAGEDKELLQSISLLPNRPETHIQTERKEVSDIHDGYDQAKLEEGNIQCKVGDNCEEKLLEPVKSDESVSVETNGGDLSGNQVSSWKKDFVSDDPIVQQCRPVLMRQKFGWMKFHPYKSTRFRPAFVYPADDKDGVEQAQTITKDGCITLAKSTFWEFHSAWELADDKKRGHEALWLKKFNMKYGSNFQ